MANETECHMIILGDANLCSSKWNNDDFLYKKVAEALRSTLLHSDLICSDIGDTYQADHLQPNGQVATSRFILNGSISKSED